MSRVTGFDDGSTSPTTFGTGSGDELGVVGADIEVDTAEGTSEPAADSGGCGACLWEATATAMAVTPLAARTPATTVATRLRRPPRIRSSFSSIRLARRTLPRHAPTDRERSDCDREQSTADHQEAQVLDA
jgi:hypothetical protein